MMRRRPNLKIIKWNNSLRFLKDFEKGDNYIIVKTFVLFLQIYFNKKGKANNSLYFINIQICHFYTSL